MPVRLEQITQLDGPSVYLTVPAVALGLSLDPGSDYFDGATLLPALEALADDAPDRVAPILTRAGQVPVAQGIGRLGLDLQRLAGVPVEHMASRGDRVWIEYRYPHPARVAARLAVQLVDQLGFGNEPRLDVDRAFRRLLAVARGADHGPVGRAFSDAARRRSIPMSTVDPSGRVVEFGTGIYRKRILGTGSTLTPSLGSLIAKDKFLASSCLRGAGIPVPECALVRTMEEATAKAESIGYPVVLKPLDLADSTLVFVDIRDEAELSTRFETIMGALVHPARQLLLEQFVRGNVYRALIVGDRVVGVFQRVPAYVIGDGRSSVQQLIDRANADPGRQRPELRPIEIDTELLLVLGRQQLTLESIPEAGRRVELKPQIGHKRDGGLARECTGELHSDNARLLIQATRTIGLDVAGIDFVTRDCSFPLTGDGGAIIEINASPDFERHLCPSTGVPRDGAAALIELLFPPGSPVRVPIVAVCGGPEAAQLTERLGVLLAASGKSVAVVANRALTVAGLGLGEHSSNYQAARMALNHPMVEIAVLESPAAEIVAFGLPFDICDLAVVTARSGNEREGFSTPETLLGRVATAQIVRTTLDGNGTGESPLDEALSSLACDAARTLGVAP